VISSVQQRASAWFDSSLVPIMELPPKDPPEDDEDENEEDDEDDDEEEEPAVREPDEC
jgi:hypothetical protein